MNATTTVHIKALDVTDLKNGVFRIEIPAQEMSEDDVKTIEKLFPNLTDKAYLILEKEALIQALATESERMAKPTEKEIHRPTFKKVSPEIPVRI